MSVKQIQEEILKLKKLNDVTILAHYYQPIEIQDIADFLGDSFGLSRTAKEKTTTEYIIFAGVNFMAETASILNQEKHVLLPNSESCCPMATFLTPEMVLNYKNKHPGLPVVTYVNSTAKVKAESDVCCTSSNSVKIVQKICNEFNTDSVLFGPDANLADYTEKRSGITCIPMPGEGHCYVHSQLTIDDIKQSRKKYPNALVLVHPECRREVNDNSDFVGSTAQMYNRVKNSNASEIQFIIGTEYGMLERLAKDFPDKKFYPVKQNMICQDMKKHTVELVKYALEHLNETQLEVKVPPLIAKKALVPIERMLNFS